METTWDESPKFESYAEVIEGMNDNTTAKKRLTANILLPNHERTNQKA